jgi:flagellar assembly factor FliW
MNMLIETSRFGLLEIDEAALIEFPWGIPGFEQVKRYVMLDHREGPFHWLQAVDEPELAFVVCEPEILGIKFLVPREKAALVDLQDDGDLLVLVIVSFDREKKSIVPHWRGPLLFNSTNRMACQWTVDSRELGRYLTSAG